MPVRCSSTPGRRKQGAARRRVPGEPFPGLSCHRQRQLTPALQEVACSRRCGCALPEHSPRRVGTGTPRGPSGVRPHPAAVAVRLGARPARPSPRRLRLRPPPLALTPWRCSPWCAGSSSRTVIGGITPSFLRSGTERRPPARCWPTRAPSRARASLGRPTPAHAPAATRDSSAPLASPASERAAMARALAAGIPVRRANRCKRSQAVPALAATTRGQTSMPPDRPMLAPRPCCDPPLVLERALRR